MDRLSAIVAACGYLASASLACDPAHSDAGPPATLPPGRVDAVSPHRASGKAKRGWNDLCDVVPSTPAPLPWPDLETAAPRQSDSQYRWVNVWASWCKPCVEELPMLVQTMAAWEKQGHKVTLTLLSVDADRAAAEHFLEAHALPPSLRLQDSSDAPGWLSQLGLGEGSSIPVHLLLDAQDALLCARAGGVSRRDLDQWRKVMFP